MSVLAKPKPTAYVITKETLERLEKSRDSEERKKQDEMIEYYAKLFIKNNMSKHK